MISPQTSTSSREHNALVQRLKAFYTADHQVELLHLHTETDLLFYQLETLKQQRLVAKSSHN
jgi:hypothetical protein